MTKKKPMGLKPISPESYNIRQISKNAVSTMVTYAWLCLLGALIDFRTTTQESILQLWQDVRQFSEDRKASFKTHMSNWEMEQIEKTVGLHPVTIPDASKIKTERDLVRYTKKVNEKAMYVTLCIILYPLLKAQYSVEFLQELIDKTYNIHDSIQKKELELWEINDALADEYDLALYSQDGIAHLAELKKGEKCEKEEKP